MLFLISSIAIPLFYAAGLMYGQRSPLVTAEYWRWWVVHLWVEGFFEVFATVVIAFLFTRLKLLSIATATRAVLFSTVIFLSGGIIGTFHHLYFTGTPSIGAGPGRGLQRAGGRAAGADRLRSVGEHSAVARHADELRGSARTSGRSTSSSRSRSGTSSARACSAS